MWAWVATDSRRRPLALPDEPPLEIATFTAPLPAIRPRMVALPVETIRPPLASVSGPNPALPTSPTPPSSQREFAPVTVAVPTPAALIAVAML